VAAEVALTEGLEDGEIDVEGVMLPEGNTEDVTLGELKTDAVMLAVKDELAPEVPEAEGLSESVWVKAGVMLSEGLAENEIDVEEKTLADGSTEDEMLNELIVELVMEEVKEGLAGLALVLPEVVRATVADEETVAEEATLALTE
jgi:hypothetical protein